MSRTPYIAGVGHSTSRYASVKQENLIAALVAQGFTPLSEQAKFSFKAGKNNGRFWTKDASIVITDLLAQKNAAPAPDPVEPWHLSGDGTH